MSEPCSKCRHGRITLHSATDRCHNPLNVDSHPPYALRHDETLCGAAGAWFEAKVEGERVYRARTAQEKESSR